MLELAAELGIPTREADLTPYDVVVTEGIPLEIGPVSGLITSEHQTPLVERTCPWVAVNVRERPFAP